MTTRHERRALHSRRLEAIAIGTAVLLTAALSQLAPDGDAADTESGRGNQGSQSSKTTGTEAAERDASTQLNGTGPPAPWPY